MVHGQCTPNVKMSLVRVSESFRCKCHVSSCSVETVLNWFYHFPSICETAEGLKHQFVPSLMSKLAMIWFWWVDCWNVWEFHLSQRNFFKQRKQTFRMTKWRGSYQKKAIEQNGTHIHCWLSVVYYKTYTIKRIVVYYKTRMLLENLIHEQRKSKDWIYFIDKNPWETVEGKQKIYSSYQS